MAFRRMFLLLALALFQFHVQSQVTQLTYSELEVQYRDAWTFQNLQIIPVRFKDPNKAIRQSNTVISLAEAMARKKVKVREMQGKDGSDIYTLEVKSDAKEHVLVQSGDMLSGGKQDRIFTETKLIEPGTTDFVDVFCIEKGRWDDKPKPFAYRGAANSDLRKTVDVTKRQTDVWREIEKQYAGAGKVTSTSSILQLFTWGRVTDSSYLKYFYQKYAESDSAFAGFITITGDKILFCELFASADLTRLAFPSLLNSAISTAVSNGAPPSVPFERVKEFLDKFLIDEATQKAYIAGHGRMQQNGGLVFHLIAYDD